MSKGEKFESSKEIQILRAIAILLVVVHHTINNLPETIGGGYMLIVANSDVTIFFMISGFLLEKNYDRYKKNVGLFIRRKAKQLIIPYLFWTLVLYIGAKFVHVFIGGSLSAFLTGFGFKELSWIQIISNTVFFQDYYVEYLWFIYVLFLYFVVNIFVGRKLNKCWIIFLILIAASILNYYTVLPNLIWKFLQHYSDFLIGRIIYYKVNCLKNRHVYPIAGAAAVICFALLNVPQLINSDILLCVLIVTLMKHILYWSVCALCFLLAKQINKLDIGTLVAHVGDYSFDIYLMHTPYVVPLLAKILSAITDIWLVTFIVTVACGILIPLLIGKYILRKIPVVRTLTLGI